MVMIALELAPFNVPNFVCVEMPPSKRQEGWHEAMEFELSELDADTLAALCSEFRRAVFTKAGKADPLELERL